MHLKPNTLLQGGKYRIVRFINSGGFGCTYEAEHVMLENRVAIKEFFVKDFCNRDESTAHVTVGTQSKKGLVNKLRQKFVDEARSICKLHHSGIVTVSDVFEENGTAYFVMDYIEGRSLSQLVNEGGPLTEAKALYYIRQVADALEYVHDHNRLHLDVKPGNIMVNGADRAILIDFGASKQYDEQDGENTSTLMGKTPGYAPLEQMGNDVVKFMPSTDIYALGATLYKLLTGITPLSANLLASGEELPPLPDTVSPSTRQAIAAALQINKNKRPQSVAEFMALLSGDDDDTVVAVDVKPAPTPQPTPEPHPTPTPAPKPSSWKKWALPLAVGVVSALAVILWPKGGQDEKKEDKVETVVQQVVAQQQEPVKPVQEQPPVKTEPEKPAVVKEEAPAPSLLYVTTSPSGATVYVDGKKVGTTPLEGKEVTQGRHTVKISKSGYESISEKKDFGEKPVVLNKTLKEEVKEASVAQSSTSQSTSASSSSSNVINGHKYVDLGLSVKWADCNVGASSPSDYGDYFAWGETSTKSDYSWATYKWCKGTETSMTKYCTNSEYGTVDNRKVLESSDDVARVKWGGSWRMPTGEEFRELCDKSKCTWTWTTQGGHNGYKVTGPNGNSIFLPAAGYRYGTDFYRRGSIGSYWSATLGEDGSYYAYNLYFDSGYSDWSNWGNRYDGRTVRPVTE